MKLSALGRFAVCLFFLLLGTAALASPPQGRYHLLKRIPLGGGEGGRDYFDYMILDVSTRRLYLSHFTHVNVIDVDTGAVVGDIPNLRVVHGIALVKDLGRGFISDGGGARVVIFDLETLKVLGQVKTGDNPDCIIYDPASRHVFTFNGRTNNSTVINPADGTVVATVPMGGRPEYAVADGKGMVYDNIMETNEVAALDSRTLTIKARWSIAPAGTPTAMAMDREHRRLFIGGRNKVLAIMNADNGKVIQTFPIGDGVDANVYEPETGRVFTSTAEGTIHIFHEDSPDKFSVVETVKTEPGARTMALDPKTHNIFTDTTDLGPLLTPIPDMPHMQVLMLPGTFRLLVYGP